MIYTFHNLFIKLIVYIVMLSSFSPMRSLVLDTATQTPTVSSSQTPAVSNTPTPLLTPATPTSDLTPGVTGTITPTTTLAPLPAFTLIFPAHTATPTKTKTPLDFTVSQTPKPTNMDDRLLLSPRIKSLSVVVIVLWLLLAGFLILYLKQIR